MSDLDDYLEIEKGFHSFWDRVHNGHRAKFIWYTNRIKRSCYEVRLAELVRLNKKLFTCSGGLNCLSLYLEDPND